MRKQDRQTGPADHVRKPKRCKVCTKQIRAGEDFVKVFHGGASYPVCCPSCATKFQANPPAYLVD